MYACLGTSTSTYTDEEGTVDGFSTSSVNFFGPGIAALLMITVYVLPEYVKSEGFTKIATITVSSWDSSN